MNFGDDFYTKKGDSKLEFADMTRGNNQQQFFDPATAYSTSQIPQYQQASDSYYTDWASQQNNNSQMNFSYFTPSPNDQFVAAQGGISLAGGGGSTQFDQEPPLLEELGINFEHIFS